MVTGSTRRWRSVTSVGSNVSDFTSAAALTAHAAIGQFGTVKLIEATPDRRARDAGNLVHGDDAAAPCRHRLNCREMALPALVELRAEQLPSLPNRFPIDHGWAIHQHDMDVNQLILSHCAALPLRTDSVIVDSFLSCDGSRIACLSGLIATYMVRGEEFTIALN